LRDAFDKRQYGDYQVLSGLEKEDIRLLIERALKFLGVTRKMLEERGTGPSGTKEPPAGYRAGRGPGLRPQAGRRKIDEPPAYNKYAGEGCSCSFKKNLYRTDPKKDLCRTRKVSRGRKRGKK
jgi:hypothetical protein